MKYTNEKLVRECYHSCPFFQLDVNVMYCGHPYFDKSGYDGYIINQENSHDRVPDECPLRKDRVDEVTMKVSLINYEFVSG